LTILPNVSVTLTKTGASRFAQGDLT
jgi:hypothetical protein